MSVKIEVGGDSARNFKSVRGVRKERTFLLYKSCNNRKQMEEEEAFKLLRENNLNEWDLKLVKKYLEVETIIERPLILARPHLKSVIFFMEHIKLICFQDFCIILSPEDDWTNKFIEEELSCIDNDVNENSNQVFIFQILEKAMESIMKKFRKYLKLIKPPLENLLYKIETDTTIDGLKMLLAVRKSLLSFESNVEQVAKAREQYLQV